MKYIQNMQKTKKKSVTKQKKLKKKIKKEE